MEELELKNGEKYFFQVESTVFEATPEEVGRVVPKWANDKKKALRVLVYVSVGNWPVYRVYKPIK